MPCLPPEEVEQYRRRRPRAFQVSVAIHELLGHGSGLLLSEISPGTYNFDIKHPPVSPLDGKPVTKWYTVGQTYSSVFGGTGQCLEECRAECVGLFLSSDKAILSLFGCKAEHGDAGFEESTSGPCFAYLVRPPRHLLIYVQLCTRYISKWLSLASTP